MALADALRDSGESVAILEGLRERLGQAFPADWARDLAGAYRSRSFVPFYRGDWDACFADSERSRQCLEDLRTALDNAFPAPWLNELAWSYGNCGVAHDSKGGWDAALADYGRAIALREDLRATLGDAFPAPWLNGLAAVYRNRGGAHDSKGDWDAALGDHGRAIGLEEDLRRALRDAFPAPWLNELAGSYMNRGNAHDSKGDQDAALADHGRAIALKEDLRAALGDAFPAPWLNELAKSYMNRGIAHGNKGDQDAALGDYGRAIALWDGLRGTLGERFPADWAIWQERTQTSYETLLAAPRPWLWAAQGLDHPPRAWSAARPATATPDWSPPPPCAGPWRARTGDAAAPLVDALASLLRPRAEPTQAAVLADGVSTLRTLALSCYPGWQLCEARVRYAGQDGALAFLVADAGALLITGDSTAIHALNQAVGLALPDPESAIDYARLFCSLLRSEAGRYQVIESADQIAWRADAEPALVQRVASTLHPVRHTGTDGDAFALEACILYGANLICARLKVYPGGQVEMPEDTPIAADLPVYPERFEGAVRLQSDAPQ